MLSQFFTHFGILLQISKCVGILESPILDQCDVGHLSYLSHLFCGGGCGKLSNIIRLRFLLIRFCLEAYMHLTSKCAILITLVTLVTYFEGGGEANC